MADLGWNVRGMLPAAPLEQRAELAELGGDLFALARSVADAQRYVAEVDRRGLERSLAGYRELGSSLAAPRTRWSGTSGHCATWTGSRTSVRASSHGSRGSRTPSPAWERRTEIEHAARRSPTARDGFRHGHGEGAP